MVWFNVEFVPAAIGTVLDLRQEQYDKVHDGPDRLEVFCGNIILFELYEVWADALLHL